MLYALLKLCNGCPTCKKIERSRDTAEDINVSYYTLMNFIKGEPITEASLERIELWIWRKLNPPIEELEDYLVGLS